jgi:hypothetical protein
MSEASGIPSWVREGQRVICISDWGGHVRWYLPKRGPVYVIAYVDAGHQNGPMLELVGIGDDRCGYKFPVNCFRPAVEDSEELGIETILYRKAGRKSKAPARESEPVE